MKSKVAGRLAQPLDELIRYLIKVKFIENKEKL